MGAIDDLRPVAVRGRFLPTLADAARESAWRESTAQSSFTRNQRVFRIGLLIVCLLALLDLKAPPEIRAELLTIRIGGLVIPAAIAAFAPIGARRGHPLQLLCYVVVMAASTAATLLLPPALVTVSVPLNAAILALVASAVLEFPLAQRYGLLVAAVLSVLPPLLLLDLPDGAALSAFALTAALATFAGYGARGRAEAERLAFGEGLRASRLIERTFPERIRTALLRGEGQIVERVDATVVFVDIVGFTPLAESLPDRQLVEILARLFGSFDAEVESRELDKVKTIGDAYMVVGTNRTTPDHAQLCCELALALRRRVREHARSDPRLSDLQVRIGLHTGTAIEGLIGESRFAYDLWGDTVNVAARMESHGEAGRIQISDTVRKCLLGRMRVSQRGPVRLKGRAAPVNAWWLESLEAEPV